MPQFRKIFPSYDWDDVWYVNQIVNLPNIIGKENIGFIKNVPNEEIKQNDAKVMAWIDKHMEGCSCLILFCGEKTHLSRWVKYELMLAEHMRLARFIVHLNGMVNQSGNACQKGIDPYSYHNMYCTTPGIAVYAIEQYSWVYDNGLTNVSRWIEDACTRAGK